MTGRVFHHACAERPSYRVEVAGQPLRTRGSTSRPDRAKTPLMSVCVVIPARYGSTRLPGKPLADIAGASMIRRVWTIARSAAGVDRVLVATDDDRIAAHVTAFGGEAVMTPESCRNGTERARAAVDALKTAPDIVINLQGDAPLTPPWIVSAIATTMREAPDLPMATPATLMSGETLEKFIAAKDRGEVGGTTVAFDVEGDALYFSKRVIPFVRGSLEGAPVYKHIGLYGYRLDTLRRLGDLPMGRFEAVEQLEQLRALENRIPIRVVEVDYRGRTPWSVDSPEDLKMVEEIIGREGEIPGADPFAVTA